MNVYTIKCFTFDNKVLVLSCKLHVYLHAKFCDVNQQNTTRALRRRDSLAVDEGIQQL